MKLSFILKDDSGRLFEGNVDLGPKGSTAKPSDKTGKKTLSDHILELRNKGVFSKAQTAREVHEKLHASYPCMLNRVEVELPRMVARKQLRKASKVVNGKTQAAYVW
jgi:hypothetical protein